MTEISIKRKNVGRTWHLPDLFCMTPTQIIAVMQSHAVKSLPSSAALTVSYDEEDDEYSFEFWYTTEETDEEYERRIQEEKDDITNLNLTKDYLRNQISKLQGELRKLENV